MAGLNKTMADNHFSSLAKKGRHGDTEIARTSKGDLWHVNPKEKALMSMYGMEGERMVDAAGSGTTNPQTGLEEKWVLAAAAVGTAIIGGISVYSGSQSRRTQARYEGQAAEEGIRSLEGASEQLDLTVGRKRLAAEKDHSMGVEGLSAETGVAKEDLEKQTAQTIQKSGLATSGTIEEKRSTMWKRIQGSFVRGKSSLMANLGKAMGDIEGWYEGEKARISSERKKFERARSLAREQQKGFFG